MKKNILIIFCLTILFVIKINAQQTVFDSTFFEPLKANKSFAKNFNPLTIDEKALKYCIFEAINIARKINKFNNSDAFIAHEILDSAAQKQADYMSHYEAKTTDNSGIFSTTQRRVKFYGGTQFVNEVVSKVKTSKGIENYSYVNLVTELLLPILNNPKQSNILLDSKWTLVGIGFKLDENNKNIYASIVVGNPRSLNPTEKETKNLSVPITTKKFGLSVYDEQKCKKCDQFINLESLQKCLVVRDGFIYFEHDDYKALRKIINRPDDGIAVDIVMKEQYQCGIDNILDNDNINRGVLIKPIFIDDMIKNNEIEEKKSTKLSVSIAEFPKEISGDYELNLLIIKESSVCRSIPILYIEKNHFEYNEIVSLENDTNSIACDTYKPIAEKATLEFKIPFEAKKFSYSLEDIEPYLNSLNEPQFTIDEISITAYTSMEGGDKKDIDIQKKRAESIVAALKKRQIPNFKYNISVSDSYEMFKNDVKYTQEYGMVNLSPSEVKEQLKGQVLKELEPMLAKHRFAKVVMTITYDINKKFEQPFVINKFNKYIEKNDLARAFSVQKYIVSQIKTGKYNSLVLSNMKIPNKEKQFIPFFNNYYFIENYLKDDYTKEMYENLVLLSQMDPKNEIVFYNKTVCSVFMSKLNNAETIKEIQEAIDLIYSFRNINKTTVDNLNLKYQYKILGVADSSKIPTISSIVETSYNKIKQIVFGTYTVNWKNANKLSEIFIKNGDYPSAIRIMNLFINDEKATPEFLFTYLSLLSHRDDYYLTPAFANTAQKCLSIDKTKLCKLLKKFSFQVLENKEVKKIYCKDCK